MNLHSREKVQRKKLAFAVDHVWTSRAEKQRVGLIKNVSQKKSHFTIQEIILHVLQFYFLLLSGMLLFVCFNYSHFSVMRCLPQFYLFLT